MGTTNEAKTRAMNSAAAFVATHLVIVIVIVISKAGQKSACPL
jgi:hypothetical protein